MLEIPYAELHSYSYYSFHTGASSPETLVEYAAQRGMPALAITDQDAVYGAVQFDIAARKHGIKPIFGAEITLTNQHHLTLLVQNEDGWQNLCRLISRGRSLAPKGKAALPPDELVGHTDGLIALSGSAKGEIPSALQRGDFPSALATARYYRELFGAGNFWIELQNHGLLKTSQQLYRLVTLARQLEIGYVATNHVHYARPEERPLQDILTCIKHRTTLVDCKVLLPKPAYYLKSAAEMRKMFATYPLALTNTMRIAERCNFSLDYGLQDLPVFPVPDGLTADLYLRQLCEEGLRQRIPDAPARAVDQLTHELEIIRNAGLSNYFLIVWDIVRYARAENIRCQGRGSAANSLVAYLLYITPISPLKRELVFERFLSPERSKTPDIDIDFQASRREEVIQYLYRRYGNDHAAIACTFVTFRERSAIREVGRALGIPSEVVDDMAKGVNARDAGKLGAVSQTALKPEYAHLWGPFASLVKQIQGFPQHTSQHPAGMVLTGPPLATRVPTEPTAMPGRVALQWNKDSLGEKGIIKVDVLGLKGLDVVEEAVETVKAITGTKPDVDSLTFDDPAVYRMICAADTIGVFQVESRAQQQVLPRMKPRNFDDLVVSISLIRPGPIQGGAVHPYLRRRRGEEPITYPHRLLEPVLAKTLGEFLYQEQIPLAARLIASFTLGEGEELRRALAKGDAKEIARFEEAFIKGAIENGVDADIAKTIFRRFRAMAGYGFPESHSASFAVVVYQTAWLKYYHPLAFYKSLLNHQPMGFWSPAVIIGDAKRHGIRVMNVDIHHSDDPCTIENGTLRLGLRYVNGLGTQGIKALLAARSQKPFVDLADFCHRTRLPLKLIERLILSGAMDTWGTRRELLWRLGEVTPEADMLDLIFVPEIVRLPPMSRAERMEAEYIMLGLTTGDHVMTLYRPWLSEQGVLSSGDLLHQPVGKKVKIAGQVAVHQAPPTAHGVRFVTVEDEDGLAQAIIRPQIYEAYRAPLHESPLLIIEGTVQREDGVFNVIATRVIPMN